MKQWVKWAVSLLLIALAVYSLDWRHLRSAFTSIRPLTFCIATAIALSQFIVNGIRWHFIVRSSTSKPFLEHMTHYLYGIFLNTFTPANIGGDVYRYVVLQSNVPGRLPIVAALIKERILGFLSFFTGYLLFVWVPLLSDSAAPHISSSLINIGYLIIACTVGIFFLPSMMGTILQMTIVRRRPTFACALTSLKAGIRFSSIVEFILLTSLSLCALLIWICTVKTLASDMRIAISWSHLAGIVILVELARLLPINIQGIGIREGGYAYLFHAMGYAPEVGFALGAISYLSLSVAIIVCGIIGKILYIREHK